MRRATCGTVCPAPAPAPTALPLPLSKNNKTLENKELLRQQLLSTSKERAEKEEPPRPKLPRSRHKNRWKLKFHHQALPQEYLDHYEQSLQKATAKAVQLKQKQVEKPKTESNIDIKNVANNTFKIWAHRLANIQRETGSLIVPRVPTPMTMANKSIKVDDRKKKSPALAPSKIVTYDDLPYMGEMTLNNSKPRRGRKPKKADICHLIYENYGTVVPGQPPPTEEKTNQSSLCPPLRIDNPVGTSKTDLQNKILTSLIERKLLQESKRRLENASPPRYPNPEGPMPAAPLTVAGPLHSDEEPLNLCIRDLTDLKIQIQKKFGNIYSSLPEMKTEIDIECYNAIPENIKSEQSNAISVIQINTNVASATVHSSSKVPLSHALSETGATDSAGAHNPSPSRDAAAAPCVYWPGAGTYVHPLALHTQLLYYQRLAAASQAHVNAHLSLEHDGLFSTSNGIHESASTEPNSPLLDNGKNKLVLKQISELLNPEMIKQAEDSKRSPDHAKMKRTSPSTTLGPVKRKRSAIFIPPMPVKNNCTVPTTEVSICKFKFTGGSKPSLQEKKMLSVDSGGNFRYYSGTGNKGNKGYECLQKDTQSTIVTTAPTTFKAGGQISTFTKEELSKKKQKSRKSLQREKLEQTFKEKGFLIQTQQLQSAEGATYCKFRQLRKFTRYLFRSWKDYLPGELEVPDSGASADGGTGEGDSDPPPPAPPAVEPSIAECG